MDSSKEISVLYSLFTLTQASLLHPSLSLLSSLMALKLYLYLLHIVRKMRGNGVLPLVFLQCPFSLLLLLLDYSPYLFMITNSHAHMALNLTSLDHITHYPSLSCP